MDDYRTRRLDAESEEPEPMDEEPGEFMLPPLPSEEQETPPPLPPAEVESPPPLPEPDIITPPPLPEATEEISQSPIVFYDAPSDPPESGGTGTVVFSSSGWGSEEPLRVPEVPSPFDEPATAPETGMPRDVRPRPITPEPVSSSRGGGVQAPPPSGPGAPVKKNQTALIIGIVAAVLLLLCCCCVLGVLVLGWSVDNWSYSMRLGASLTQMLL
jgi:hypothetical protein